MKNKSQEIIRVQNVIENDRLNVGKGFTDLFVEDFSKLVKDYFEIEKQPVLNIVKDKNGYKVEISFYANRVKPFNLITN